MQQNPLSPQAKIIELVPGLKVGAVPMELIHPRRTNYRKMTKEQSTQLKASVDRFGFATLVVLCAEKDGTYGIVDGHHRIAEAKARGMTVVPAVILEVEALDADLGMFSFNVSAETVPSEYYDFIKELQLTVDNSELAQFTGLTQDFLSDLKALEDAAPKPDPMTDQGEAAGRPPKNKGKKLVILTRPDGTIKKIMVVPEAFDVPVSVHTLVEDMGCLLTTHVVGSLPTMTHPEEMLRIMQMELAEP